MTTVKVNAKKNEVSDLTKMLMTGLDLSFRRLVVLRSRHNGTMCFCDEKGNIYTVKAKDVKTMMGAYRHCDRERRAKRDVWREAI